MKKKGGDLSKMIEKRKKINGIRFEASLIIKICKEIIYGIDFLHEHNIIHRDLKPGYQIIMIMI